jgi:hypothetical protein
MTPNLRSRTTRRLGASAHTRLIVLGRILECGNLPRAAALAFVSAARSAERPFKQAELYVAAASSLINAGASSDLNRAAALLSKAQLLLHRDRSNAACHVALHSYVLIESVRVRLGDHDGTGRVIADAQAYIAKIALRAPVADLAKTYRNFITYREIQHAFITPPLEPYFVENIQTEQQVSVSYQASIDCEQRGEFLAAAGFALSHFQLWLSTAHDAREPSTVVDSVFDRVRSLLTKAERLKSAPCIARLHLANLVLHGLSLLRKGHAPQARELVVHIRTAMGKVSESMEENGKLHNPSPSWTWLPSSATHAIVLCFFSSVTRNIGGCQLSMQHSLDALVAAGFVCEEISIATDGSRVKYSVNDGIGIFDGQLEPASALALSILLLDSAARSRMVVGDMTGTRPLIACATELLGQTERNTMIERATRTILRVSIDLLTAEMNSLCGLENQARRQLETILAHSGGESLGDIFHLVVAHLALHTGKSPGAVSAKAKRAVGQTQHVVSKSIAACLKLAEGFAHVIQGRVVEAKIEIKAGLQVIGTSESSVNEQVVSSLMLALGCLFVNHKIVTHEALELVTEAAKLSTGDPFSTVKALRFQHIMVDRMASSPEKSFLTVQTESSLRAAETLFVFG